jgi:hypothetical protein
MNVRDAVRWIDRHFAESENKYQIAEMSDSEKYNFLVGSKPVSVLK